MSETTGELFTTPGALRKRAGDLREHGGQGADPREIADLLDRAAQRLELGDDRMAVQRFANLMTVKMARKLHEGRHGWTNVPVAHLWAMLREHVDKGDPVDVANFAMMIHHNSETRGQ